MITPADYLATPPVWRALVSEINGGRIPDGEPGIRDVDAPCEAFQPAEGEPDGSGSCETDGHYICAECVHIELATLRRRQDRCEECGERLTFRSTTDTYGDCPRGCTEPEPRPVPKFLKEEAEAPRGARSGE